MNALIHSSAASEAGDTLLAEVDFKWLMAGQGCWVDAVRLHQDRAYASACLATARSLPCEPLAACADLLQGLGAGSAA
jgi:hypothetical protein